MRWPGAVAGLFSLFDMYTPPTPPYLSPKVPVLNGLSPD
jgi:hypothetical protein